MRYCPRCGAKNTSGDPVCVGCGQKLYGLLTGQAQAPCRSCGTANPTNASFCLGCGRAAGPASGRPGAEATPAPAGVERSAPPSPARPGPTGPDPAGDGEPDQVSSRTTGCLVATSAQVRG